MMCMMVHDHMTYTDDVHDVHDVRDVRDGVHDDGGGGDDGDGELKEEGVLITNQHLKLWESPYMRHSFHPKSDRVAGIQYNKFPQRHNHDQSRYYKQAQPRPLNIQ
jgi:hypothetical protein